MFARHAPSVPWTPFFVTLLKVGFTRLSSHLAAWYDQSDTSFPSACFAGKCVWKSEVEGLGQEEPETVTGALTAPSNRSASGTPIHWRLAPPLGFGMDIYTSALYPHFLNNLLYFLTNHTFTLTFTYTLYFRNMKYKVSFVFAHTFTYKLFNLKRNDAPAMFSACKWLASLATNAAACVSPSLRSRASLSECLLMLARPRCVACCGFAASCGFLPRRLPALPHGESGLAHASTSHAMQGILAFGGLASLACSGLRLGVLCARGTARLLGLAGLADRMLAVACCTLLADAASCQCLAACLSCLTLSSPGFAVRRVLAHASTSHARHTRFWGPRSLGACSALGLASCSRAQHGGPLVYYKIDRVS